MFVDYVNVVIKSGDGGKGIVNFHREKFVPKGTPDGGDGGKGGDVFFIGEKNMNTLLDYTYHRQQLAEDGHKGGKNNMTGKSGKNVIVKVPLGTLVKDKETNEVLAEILEDGVPVRVLQGGKGGLGNQHFKSSTNQAPKHSQPGTPGERREVNLELKVLADVGLVGFPNAGKSTLLSVVSNARPKIADYPFTTIVPNLGIVKYEHYKSFVMADIPGLIKGASLGKGLGHQFLRHVERTRVLVYMISADSEDFQKDFEVLQNEVNSFSDEMHEKPIIKVLTKADIIAKEDERDLSFFDHQISSFSLNGIEELKLLIAEKIKVLDTPVW